ncbi:hypothetical protein NA57DRAFT_39948 [Rhizodiscina lignyota]|uniref:Nephrocystin 3-like N-terminal domain-containing protein n=1 Tax=Rhizodiscina lignyota TaxID=1504668 RepID=A0A9P4IFR3_9PEZI|nr:hypothetical protein NA57DRAFT_39948 [Rhizodiscina lignyota]
MDPLSITASTIALLEFTGEVISYLNAVKTSSKDRARLAIEASQLFNLLTTLNYLIEDSINTPWGTTIRALNVENGPFDQYYTGLLQLQERLSGAKRSDRSKLHTVKDALVWKFTKEEVADILGRMERLKGLIAVALEVDNLTQKVALSIQATTKELEAKTREIKSTADGLQQNVNHQRYQEIMNWISSDDFEVQQSDIISRKQAGTGKWFLEYPEFINWRDMPKQTLFCPGIPGAGKTMMAAATIDHLKVDLPHNVGVAFVFCNYKGKASQTEADILAAMLKQLVQVQPSAAASVFQLYEKYPMKNTRPTPAEILGALKTALDNYTAAYIVVDALDECKDRNTREVLVKDLLELQQITDVRLLVTSRFIPEIEAMFKQTSPLEVRASEEDVRRYVAGQLHRMPECIRQDSEIQNEIQNAIAGAVDGM